MGEGLLDPRLDDLSSIRHEGTALAPMHASGKEIKVDRWEASVGTG